MVSITRDCILEKYHKSKASPAAVKMARKRTVRSRRKLRRILSPGMVAPFRSVDPGSSMRLRPRCQDGFRERDSSRPARSALLQLFEPVENDVDLRERRGRGGGGGERS